MSLSISVTAGKTLARNERANNAKLNALGLPTLTLSGAASTAQLGDNTVTAVKAAYGPWFYCTDGGTANAHSLTAAASGTTLPTSLVAGQEFAYTAANTNTGAVTVAISGIAGTKALTKNGTTALVAGDVRSGQLVWVRYDGTQFQIASPNAQPRLDRYATTSSADGLAYTATFSPTLTALTNGTRVLVKLNTTNTGAVTFAPDGLTAKAVRKLNDAALSAGDVLADQIVALVYDSTLDHWLLISPVVVNTPATVVGLTRGLVVKNHTSNPTYQVTVTADDIVLKNSGGLSYLAEAVSLTLTLSASGANGLDTGSEASSTWYYVWAIYNGSTVAGLFSTSSTSPTLPSGYTYKALLGAVFNDSGSDLDNSLQYGRQVWIDDTNIFTAKTGVATYTILGGADATAFATCVPPIARSASGTIGTNTNSKGMAVAGDANGLGAQTVAGQGSAGTTNGFVLAGAYTVPLKTAQILYYKMEDTTATSFRLSCSGYTL